LESHQAHIWRAGLQQEPSTVRKFLDILAPEERERADKFHFRKDYEHFVVARGVLRNLLGGYLNKHPASIRFSYNQYGKPALADGRGDKRLCFNMSHSHELALYGFVRGREIGLDVEFMCEDSASLEVAKRFFAPQEVATLRALSQELQTTAFFNCWTRKEAYIKALGEGLSHPLNSFAVSFAPGEVAALLSTDNDPQEASRWSVVEIIPATGYAAALVVKRPTPTLRCWQWLNNQ
jgi:4'-phosphopantetheinyl transferase